MEHNNSEIKGVLITCSGYISLIRYNRYLCITEHAYEASFWHWNVNHAYNLRGGYSFQDSAYYYTLIEEECHSFTCIL